MDHALFGWDMLIQSRKAKRGSVFQLWGQSGRKDPCLVKVILFLFLGKQDISIPSAPTSNLSHIRSNVETRGHQIVLSCETETNN